MDKYKLNVYRISFNPPWATGSRPYTPEYVDYFLANCGYYIIIDRNHHTSSDVVDWIQAEASIFEVLSRWGNKDSLSPEEQAKRRRVLVEIVNEFVWDTEGTVWDHVAPIIQRIKAAGYTNKLLINKHTQENDWRPIGADYYGKHAYFNNLNDPTTKWQTLWAAQMFMEDAIAAGCVPLANTEIGAHFGENQSFTPENVATLNQFLAWCNQRGIGNCVWMNKDLQNLARYEELGLKIPPIPTPTPKPSVALPVIMIGAGLTMNNPLIGIPILLTGAGIYYLQRRG